MSETQQAENFPDLAVVPALLLPRLRRPHEPGVVAPEAAGVHRLDGQRR